MDIGSLITASRSGVVIDVEESGFDGEFPNNFVIVQHEDGTYAQYLHLTHDGALAELGDRVVSGDEIGLSGNTGLAGTAHLHFVITQPRSPNPPYVSLPVTFRNTLSNSRSLAEGYLYPALPY